MEPNPNCIPLDGECTDDQNGCCNPAGNVVCKGNRWYRQCQLSHPPLIIYIVLNVLFVLLADGYSLINTQYPVEDIIIITVYENI